MFQVFFTTLGGQGMRGISLLLAFLCMVGWSVSAAEAKACMVDYSDIATAEDVGPIVIAVMVIERSAEFAVKADDTIDKEMEFDVNTQLIVADSLSNSSVRAATKESVGLRTTRALKNEQYMTRAGPRYPLIC